MTGRSEIVKIPKHYRSLLDLSTGLIEMKKWEGFLARVFLFGRHLETVAFVCSVFSATMCMYSGQT